MNTENLAEQLLSELLKQNINVSSWLASMGIDKSLLYRFVRQDQLPGKLLSFKIAVLLATLRGEKLDKKTISILWQDNPAACDYVQRILK